MQVVLDNPFNVLMTDHKILTGEQLTGVILKLIQKKRPSAADPSSRRSRRR